ncbi:MAG: hypothetical protein EHM45_21560 [Desulfobacteraceae bacterium]|nr:MAG: hypothetical protein EHM45_21560 [Desulfobacteraceae bacterium]
MGADNASFSTPALTQTTSYWVRVSNGAGQADSSTAAITVQGGGGDSGGGGGGGGCFMGSVSRGSWFGMIGLGLWAIRAASCSQRTKAFFRAKTPGKKAGTLSEY